MTDYARGDHVVAIRDIGGWSRPSVATGSAGTVVQPDSWGSGPTVVFNLKPKPGAASPETVKVMVRKDEIRPLPKPR